jgi:hypothetical protein
MELGSDRGADGHTDELVSLVGSPSRENVELEAGIGELGTIIEGLVRPRKG